MEEVCREAELELMIDRAKNQLLLLQFQRDRTQFQQKVNTSDGKKLYFFHFPFSLSSYFYHATIQRQIFNISLRHMYFICIYVLLKHSKIRQNDAQCVKKQQKKF